MPIGALLSKIRVALLIYTFGSAADVFSTWRCWKTLKPSEAHEGNLIVIAFVQHFGVAAGLVGCKVVAAIVVFASSVILGRMFSRHVTDFQLADALFVALGCLYFAAGAWNAYGMAYGH